MSLKILKKKFSNILKTVSKKSLELVQGGFKHFINKGSNIPPPPCFKNLKMKDDNKVVT